MTWLWDALWIPLGAVVGLAVALDARARALADLASRALDETRVREIRRLLSERAWYGGVMHGVSLEVHPTASGAWWLTWGRDRDGLVPDDQLDGELLRWLRGER